MQIWGAGVKDDDLCGANFDVKRIEELSVMKKIYGQKHFILRSTVQLRLRLSIGFLSKCIRR